MFDIEKMKIKPLCMQAMDAAREHLDDLVKPIGALGGMEELAVRLAGITGVVKGDYSQRAVLVFAADNGIWDEGISPVPQEVTAAQTLNILNGLAGGSVLCRWANAGLRVVDVGIKAPIAHPFLIARKVCKGTASIAQGPAMTRQQALEAMQTGFDQAQELIGGGVRLLGIGEMGICNTATSAAVLCALTGAQVLQAVGKGAGVDEAAFQKKRACVARALEVNKPDPQDPIGVLAKVGGLDIAAMAGAYIACGVNGIPAVVDGYISIVAALAACRLLPKLRDYLIASHRSFEPGYALAVEALGLRPMIHLDMRLGEGSGCPLAFAVIDAAMAVMRDMGTFSQGNIDAGSLVDIRE